MNWLPGTDLKYMAAHGLTAMIRYDELWTLANSSEERFDHEKRLGYVAEMESIWLDNVSGIPVIELIDKTLKADRVQLAADQWVNRVGFGWIYASVTDAE